jgi:hypothetical protein
MTENALNTEMALEKLTLSANGLASGLEPKSSSISSRAMKSVRFGKKVT